MARYIDADALIKKIFPYDVVDKKCYTINAKMIYEAIQKAPTADVAPKSEVAREIITDVLNIIRNYSYDTLVAKSNCCNMTVIYIGEEILKLKKKYTEEKE